MSNLGKLREALKISIYVDRAVPRTSAGYAGRRMPLCPFCGKMVRPEDADMHEALISKGMVRGNDPNGVINSRFNCVIRHHDTPECKHTGGVGGDEAFEKAARYLIKWEGYEPVATWLAEASLIWPIVGKEALTRFEGLFKEKYLSGELR